MSIIRVHKQRGEWAIVPKAAVNDESLSWEARGMLLYLLEKPDDWQIMFQDLVRKSPAQDDKCRRILKELEGQGYVHRKRFNRPDGTFAWESAVFETPQAPATEAEEPCAENRQVVAEPYAGLPYMVEPHMAEPHMVNRHIYKDLTMNNNENTKKKAEKESDDDDDGKPAVEQPLTPALDTEWGTAFGLFQSQLGWMGGAGPTLDEMREYFDELRSKGFPDWWASAVKVAVDNNARSWAYVRQVLRTALESNRPPGSPKAQKGSNASNGTHRNGRGPGYSGKPYDDGLSSLTTAERETLSAQLRATRNRQQSLPGV